MPAIAAEPVSGPQFDGERPEAPEVDGVAPPVLAARRSAALAGAAPLQAVETDRALVGGRANRRHRGERVLTGTT
jgi:hypothetical protein